MQLTVGQRVVLVAIAPHKDIMLMSSCDVPMKWITGLMLPSSFTAIGTVESVGADGSITLAHGAKSPDIADDNWRRKVWRTGEGKTKPAMLVTFDPELAKSGRMLQDSRRTIMVDRIVFVMPLQGES